MRLRHYYRLMNKAGDGDGSGSGTTPPPAKGTESGSTPDLAKEFTSLKEQNAALLARLDKLEGKGAPSDDDLTIKAQKLRDSENQNTNKTKALENALKFDLKSEEFLKTNAQLLPKDIGDIFRAAQKETYTDAIEKDSAIKAGIVQSFFAVQANMDLLTAGQKQKLDEYLKLTKTSKQDKALMIYDEVFEPTFEMLKRIKKAEALSKGYGGGSSSDDAYKNKMMSLSKKHYLGEKQ